MTLRIDDFPQLRLITWSIPYAQSLEDSEAFSFYKRYWRFIDQNTLDAAERALIMHLADKFRDNTLNI